MLCIERSMMSQARARKRCLKCNQLLSYSAYTRHRNPFICQGNGGVKPLTLVKIAILFICTGNGGANVKPQASSRSDDTHDPFIPDSEDHEITESTLAEHSNSDASSTSSSSDSESEVQDSIEMIDDTEDISSILHDDAMGDPCNQESRENDTSLLSSNVANSAHHMENDLSDSSVQHESSSSDASKSTSDASKSVIQFVSYFVAFLQLVYKLSDRCITLLLVFIQGLLNWLALIVPPPANAPIKNIADSIPQNVYYLKKSFHHPMALHGLLYALNAVIYINQINLKLYVHPIFQNVLKRFNEMRNVTLTFSRR